MSSSPPPQTPSSRRGQNQHGSLLGSIFLAPPSALYASIDQAPDQLPLGRSQQLLPHYVQQQQQQQHNPDPFLLQPSDMDQSVAPASPPRSAGGPRVGRPSSGGGGSARSLLAQMQPNRTFAAVHEDDISEEDEEESRTPGQGTPRGRQPSQSIMMQQAPGHRPVTPSSTRCSSHSRSPPPDLTHHAPLLSPSVHSDHGDGLPHNKASIPTQTTPASTTSGFQIEGLHLGGGGGGGPSHNNGSRLLASITSLCRALGFVVGLMRRSGGGGGRLDRRQKALWLWVNVDDLDAFLSDVYSYYAGKGIYCIALAKALSLITVGFVIAFSTFLLRCVNYSTIRSQHRLQDALVSKCVTGHPFTLALVLLASFVYLLQIISFSRTLTHLSHMHNFFEELLEVPDSDIQTIPWDIIVNRLSNLRAEHPSAPSLLQNQSEDGPVNPLKLDAHDVANRVMREENYMVALFNRDVLDLSVPWPRPLVAAVPALQHYGRGDLTRVLEWNIRKGVLQYLFGPGAKVRKAFLDTANREVLIDGLRRRLVLLGWLNAVFAPFIILYVLLYSFFRYFEEYHKNPSSIGSRKFTNMARWRFREYNELPHIFDRRLHMAHPLAETYLDQFPKAKTAMVARFVAFIAGAFASVLVLFSILDPDAFLHFEVTPDRSVLFYIGLFGGILAVARGMVPEEHRIVNPEQVMQEIVQHTHYMPDHWQGHLHSHQVHADFSSLFEMKITTFFIELLSVVTTPFVLWYTLPACAPKIIDFFREFTIHVDGLGYVCSFGVFDFRRPDKIPRKNPHTSATKPPAVESKLDQSMLHFARAHPAWIPRDQSTSIYLSHMQNLHPTKFHAGPPGMASTTLINEEQQLASAAAARTAHYESAFYKSGGGSNSGRSNLTATQQLRQDNRITEEEGLGQSYDHSQVHRRRGHPETELDDQDDDEGDAASLTSAPPAAPSLVNMFIDPDGGRRHVPW